MTVFRGTALNLGAGLTMLALLGSASGVAMAQVPTAAGMPQPLEPQLPRETPEGTIAANATPTLTTLQDAIARAYWSNPTLVAERSTLKSVDTLYPLARSNYGPQVTLQGSHQFTRTRAEIFPGLYNRPEGFSSTAQIIFSQPVTSFGRRASAEQNALAQVALEREQLRLVEASTMFGVISAYVSVIRDRNIVELAHQNLSLLERQFSDGQKRFAVRDITSSDLQQVQTRVEFGRAQLLNAQGQLGSSQSLFLQATGGLPGALTTPPELALGVPSLDAAYAMAENGSPIIRGAQSREKVSRAQIAQAQAERNPNISLESSGTYGPTNIYQNQLRTTDLRSSVVVTMPLIDSGTRRLSIERARQQNDADWRLVDAALRETRQSVAEAWDAHRAALASLIHLRDASAAAQAAYDGAVIQERAGDRTTLDVLDLARDLLNIRTSYATAEASEYIARARLLSAMGNLEAPKLISGLPAYDVNANFDRVKRKGDIPLLTPILSGLDGLTTGNVIGRERPVRDPSGAFRVESAVTPLEVPPAPPVQVPSTPTAPAKPPRR